MLNTQYDKFQASSPIPAPPVKLFYRDEFVLPLPPGYLYPMEKLRLLPLPCRYDN